MNSQKYFAFCAFSRQIHEERWINQVLKKDAFDKYLGLGQHGIGCTYSHLILEHIVQQVSKYKSPDRGDMRV